MLNDSPDQCPPARKRTVSVGKYEQKDTSADLAPPSAKLSHVAAEPLTKLTPLTTGPGSTRQPWAQTVQPLSTYTGATVRMSDFSHLKWHQPSTEMDPSSLFLSDIGPASFASPSNYTPVTSGTPLAPISELLSPQQFTSYNLSSVEIPSPPSYVTVQMGDQLAFGGGHSLTALSSVTMLDASSQPSLETYGGESGELPTVMVDSSLAGTEVLSVSGMGVQWTPGWSMLRQMLSQSHRENALMHGVASDGQLNPISSTTTTEYSAAAEDQAAATEVLQFMSTDHGFHHVNLPQGAPVSDVVYVQVSANANDTSTIPQLAADSTEDGAQTQPIAGYAEVPETVDVSVPKTVDTDNNNESVAGEKSI